MIRAIEMLVQEHRVINSVLNCLELFVQNSERDKYFDPIAAQVMVSFFKEFADACHHGKEEDVLFIRSNAKTGDHGPVKTLEEEHREGRGYIGEMQQAIDSAIQAKSIDRFCDNARDFIDMLRRHIIREDSAVFPMIDELLDADEARALWKDFQHVESKAGDRQKRLTGVARELCKQYGVSFPEDEIGELT